MRVVLITPESAIKKIFAVFLNCLKERGQLNRIIIDEYHIILNERWNFKRKLIRIKKLDKAGI